jgi:hypothetical protein
MVQEDALMNEAQFFWQLKIKPPPPQLLPKGTQLITWSF